MRFSLPYNFYRILGISGLCCVGYIVVVGVFGNVNIGRFMPIKLATAIAMHWPELPFFSVEKITAPDGKTQETYYTVPTRQLTVQEIAQLEANKKKTKSTSDATAATAAK